MNVSCTLSSSFPLPTYTYAYTTATTSKEAPIWRRGEAQFLKSVAAIELRLLLAYGTKHVTPTLITVSSVKLARKRASSYRDRVFRAGTLCVL